MSRSKYFTIEFKKRITLFHVDLLRRLSSTFTRLYKVKYNFISHDVKLKQDFLEGFVFLVQRYREEREERGYYTFCFSTKSEIVYSVTRKNYFNFIRTLYA